MTRGLRPLARSGRPPAVRIAHLGLGAFHRAHQAPWTAEVSDWGIAAFAGRRPDLARALTAQGGVYSLVVRADDGDRVTHIGAIADAVPAEDVEKWLAVMADPSTAMLTLTVTEAAYCRDSSGALDRSLAAVAADLDALRATPAGRALRAAPAPPPLRTVPARLVAGLSARRLAGAGGMAVVPCDNLEDNGRATRRIVLDAAAAVDPELAAWIAEEVSFVSTVVDRITPAATDEDRATVGRLTGFDDLAPVVTEPWREWVLAGSWPAGRPNWQEAGARFVGDVGPWARRKLRLLNGGHSLLAYHGSARGHTTVAEAVADPECREWLLAWWAEAASTLDAEVLPVERYCEELLGRFANRHITHGLAQIARDGGEKLAVRIAPVLRQRLDCGLDSPAATMAIASWLQWLRSPAGRSDPSASLTSGPLPDAGRAVVAVVAPDLAGDGGLVGGLVGAVRVAAERYQRPGRGGARR